MECLKTQATLADDVGAKLRYSTCSEISGLDESHVRDGMDCGISCDRVRNDAILSVGDLLLLLLLSHVLTHAFSRASTHVTQDVKLRTNSKVVEETGSHAE